MKQRARLLCLALASVGSTIACAQEHPSSVEGAVSLSAKGALANPGQTPPPSPPLPPPPPLPSPTAPAIRSGSPRLPYGVDSPEELSIGGTTAPITSRAPLRLPPAPAATVDASGAPTSLPPASGEPLKIDFSTDPVLRFVSTSAPPELFRATIAHAVEGHPAVREAEAAVTGARATVRQAASGLYPTLDLSVTSDYSITRGFGDDNNSLIERLRPRGRTDADATLTQNILDFGATARRIKASRAREEGAKADVETAAEQVAGNAIAAWYDLAGYRALVRMGEALAQSQHELTDAIKVRIVQGLSAESDLARIETYTTNADARLAQYRRSLAEAEARYEEAVGSTPPPDLGRPMLPAALPTSVDDARLQAHNSSQVRSAEAEARASQQDYAAAAADNLPKVQGVIDAGRYGVLEGLHDYDVRGRIVIRHRLFGGGQNAHKDEVEARFLQARAAADRAEDEAERDAAIGFTDLQASSDEVRALTDAYKSNRQARDAIVERFRVTQGNLIDVLNAEDSYFAVAASLIQAVTRADAERLVLLQRAGGLLPALGVTLPETRR